MFFQVIAAKGPLHFFATLLSPSGDFVSQDGLDNADEGDTQRQGPILVQGRQLAVHGDQARRIAVSQFVQLATAAITRIHKNAPVVEFGARVQKRADAENA